MNETEQKIIEIARLNLQYFKQKIQSRNTMARYIELPFFDGISTSFIRWDTIEKEFVNIRYQLGVGEGVTTNGSSGAYFSETKSVDINITGMLK
jgi:hypothetical protein